MFVSSGAGGCCDCGDPEAWKHPLHCSLHVALHEEPASVDPAVEADVGVLFRVLLDFVVVSLARWDAAPFTPKSITLSPAKKAVAEHLDEDEISCAILWNDEVHSYQEVIDQVSEAISCSENDAKDVATTIDTVGRDIIAKSSNVKKLLSIASHLTAIGLGVSIWPIRDFYREHIAALVVKWFLDLSKNSFYRRILADLMLQHVGDDSILVAGEYEINDIGVLAVDDDTKVDRKRKFAAVKHLQHLRNRLLSSQEQSGIVCELCYIDVFFQYDWKLWKSLRSAFKNLFVSCLLAEINLKKSLGYHFAFNYPSLIEKFLNDDREPEYSIARFSVQLFTVPSIVSDLESRTNFFVSTLLNLKRVLLHGLSYLPISEGDYQTLNIDDERFKNHLYFQLLGDLNALIKNTSSDFSPWKVEFLRIYVQILSCFSGIDANTRQRNSHVEYEHETWINAFSFSLKISLFSNDLINAFFTEANSGFLVLQNVFLDVTEVLFSILLRQKPNLSIVEVVIGNCLPVNIIDYAVSEQPVSFHHPVHWIAAVILRKMTAMRPNYNVYEMVQFIAEAAPEFDGLTRDEFVSYALLEFPLRTLVKICQIKSGLWVRNGFSIRNQAHNYTNIFKESMLESDLFLIKSCAELLHPDQYLAVLLNRFELQELFQSHPAFRFEQSPSAIILEEFLLLLIYILTDTSSHGAVSESELIRKDIIQILATGPKKYSEIEKRVCQEKIGATEMQQILVSVAELKGTSGLTGSAKYELRETCFAEYDPYYFFFVHGERDDAERYMTGRGWSNSNPRGRLLSHLENNRARFSGALLRCDLMYHIVFYVFNLDFNQEENNSEPRSKLFSYNAVNYALYIMELAVSNFKDDFLAKMVTIQKVRACGKKSSLLELLLEVTDSPLFADFRERINFIVSRFDGTFPLAKEIISVYEAKSQAIQHTQVKEDAKKRKAQIMEQFSKAQTSFMDKFADLYDDVASDDEDMDADENMVDLDSKMEKLFGRRSIGLDDPTCIVCQEIVKQDKPSGLLGLFQSTKQVYEWDPIYNNFNLQDGPCDESSLDSTEPGIHFRSCGHIIHRECFDGFYRSIRAQKHPADQSKYEFVCPLCKFLCNTIVPICFEFQLSPSELFNVSVDCNTFSEWLDIAIKVSKESMNVVESQTELDDVEKKKQYIVQEHYNSDTSKVFTFNIGLVRRAINRLGTEVIDTLQTRSWLEQHGNVASNFDSFAEKIANHFQLPYDELCKKFDNCATVDNLGDFFYEKTQARSEYNILETAQSLPHLYRSSALWRSVAYSIHCIVAAREDKICDNKNAAFLMKLLSPSVEYSSLRILTEAVLDAEKQDRDGYSLPFSFAAVLSTFLLDELFVSSPTSRSYPPILLNDSFDVAVSLYLNPAIMESTLMYQNKNSIHSRQFLIVLETVRIISEFLSPGRAEALFELSSVGSNDSSNLELSLEEGDGVFSFSKLLELVINSIYDGVCDSIVRMELPSYEEVGDLEIETLVSAFQESKVSMFNQLGKIIPRLRSITEKFLTQFLLKLIVLIQHGLGFDLYDLKSLNSSPIFSACLEKLGLPGFDDIIRNAVSTPCKGLIESWCLDLGHTFGPFLLEQYLERKFFFELAKKEVPSSTSPLPPYTVTNLISPSLRLPYPGPYRLTQLPSRYDDLILKANESYCSRCDSIPVEPALCLMCGQIICAQSFCCASDGQGECNLHMAACDGEIGLYLLVKKCRILILHSEHGTVIEAPYLDIHGETDEGFKRGRPLFLNKDRYEELNKVWVSHDMPSLIARRSENNPHAAYMDWQHF